jgi:NAD(P)-dependent dehydrogenase (short-subunit alcohol dehydrogenase family)
MKDYTPRPDLLKDRVILITGASGAIGSAAAQAYAAHGATTILLGRTPAKLESLYDAIEAAGHPQPAMFPVDFEKASPQDYAAIAQGVEKTFGRLDGLLHAAGQLGTLTPLEHYDLALWSRVMQVNLNAAFMMTRACLPLLKQAEDASVIFNTSQEGRKGKAYWGAYGISHAAVENMMQIFADELEANTRIRVNSLDSGPVRSRQRALAFPGEDPNSLPTPEEVMGDYLYLMGSDSQGLTGRQWTAEAIAST